LNPSKVPIPPRPLVSNMKHQNRTPGPTRKTVAVISLGCPKNTVDSEVMLGRLAGADYQLVQDPAEAEVVVVNTCGFIEAAKKESIDAILGAAKYKKNGRLRTLVVGGCLAQRYGDELKKELPEIDLMFGLNDVEQVAEKVMGRALPSLGLPKPLPEKAPLLPGSMNEATYVYDASSPRLLSTPAHYAYVKISEGCDLPCTFCIIPKIRGHYRSRSLEDIETEARGLARRGVKEACLVAQDSTWYGSDLYGKPRIAELLRRLSTIDGLEWVRLHYLYPSRVTEELLEAMDHPKIAPYFDVPLQHASDKILKSMKRIGGRRQLEEMLGRIRAKFPRASLRSTFIVGYPGETEEDFNQLLDFLEKARLDYAGFFPYSKEEGTPAGEMGGQVEEEVQQDRLARAYGAQERIATDSHGQWVGERLRAVVEGREKDGTIRARTKYQAPEVDGVVWVDGAPHAKPGDWLDVEVTHVMAQDLVARVVTGTAP